jgi:amino acid adenylation domain-containing protein/non-ribosomal peptide synthase protein (TIGR01720 family)
MQLLPIQREFLEADAPSHNHDSQAVLLTAPAGFDLPLVVEALYHRHDALRLRFAPVDWIWEAVETPLTASMISESCVLETLPEDPDLQSNFIRERCAHYLRSLDITNGPVFRAVYLQGHAEKQGRLFLVIHRLVMDQASWRVLLRDLDTVHRQISSGESIKPTTEDSSYQQWGEALTDFAMSDALQSEWDYWNDNVTSTVEPWPVTPLSKEPAYYTSTRNVPVQLSVAETATLLKDCTATYHTGINELLLSAVYMAMCKWSDQTRVRITLEDHCRDLFPEIDVTDTIGCFTTNYPIVLHSETPDLPAVIKSVKEQYRAVPHHGIGYGLLCDQMLIDAAAADPPVLLFRYQGELSQVMHSVDPHRLRSHALCLSGSVAGGALRFKLEYSERQYSKETMVALVGHLENALRMLIAHSQVADTGYYTVSDFPLATIDQVTLDEWQTTFAIEELYPATAMQKGMHFHSLLDAAAYVTQLYSTIEGDLRLPLLQRAWQMAIDRHAMLRTVFVGAGDAQHQLVIKQALLPWYEEDVKGMSAEEQNERFEQYRQADRAQGFVRTHAPLMRLSMFRISDDQYRLLWSHHHSLLDGWSIRLVFTEVMQVYAALNAGLDPVLPAVAEYVRYVEWLQAQDKEKAYQYWQEYLADIETVTRLPYDTQAREQDPIHEMQEVSLSADDLAQLKALAKRHHTTVNTLMQLAWGLVLQSYTGDEKVVFGTVTSGRMAEVAEVERMVGLCISSIPVVVSLAENESLAEATRRLHSTFQLSQKHAYLPLAEIQNQSRLSKGTALFESLLVFENYTLDAGADRAGPIRMGEFGANLQDTYPLVVTMFQRESLQVLCRYFGNLFSAATITRMLDQFIRVLQELPNRQAVADIRLLLTAAERQQQSELSEMEPRRSIAAVFEEQVQQRPDGEAVVMGERSWSYAELNRRANQLGHYLRELGVGPEVSVGLCVERSLEMVVGMLGILKAGGAYVPLDASYPTERLAYMLADAGVAVVLTQASLVDALPSHWGQVVSLDEEWEEIAQQSEENLESSAGGENLAYVMYTSGSTGEPKGVAVVQRGVVRLVKETNYAEFGPAETFVQLAPQTFDASTFEVWGSLLNGGRLVVLEPGAPTLEELGAALRGYGVSTMWLTAGLFHLLVDERPEELRGLKQLLAGGDVLSPEHVKKALPWLAGGCVINGYGPTENTTFSCCQRIERETEVGASVPIGRPIANTQAYVLNQQLQQVAVGVVGELYLGGDGLARGYQQRAELTAEKFVPHPYSVSGGERLYRTGDLVRYLADGRLEFVGRVDQQVKVRGFRIEPGEIETVLTRHHSLRQCVVVPRQEGIEKQLIAYIVTDNEQSLTADDIRTYLREHLPEYMIPSHVVFLDSLPLNTNGKVDKSALPSPADSNVPSQDFVAPRTPAEIALAEVWKRVLGVDRVGADDNFFDLGGDSIRSIQLRAQAQNAGYDFSVQEIFENQTIASLALVAKRIDGRVAQSFKTDPFDLITPEDKANVPAEIEDAYPLSLMQRGMLFHSELNPHDAIYQVVISFQMRTRLDRTALEAALQQAAARHPILRTSFDLQHYSEPLQLVHRTVKPQLSFIDQQHLSPGERKQFLADWIEEEKQQSFDFTQPPLIRFSIFRYSDDDFQFNIRFHHAMFDGWSMNTLMSEIFANYISLRDGVAQTEEAPLSLVFRDFIALERQALQSEEVRNYWSERLTNLPVTALPLREGAAPPAAKKEMIQLSFDSELVERLRSFARLARVPLKSVFLAAHMKILGLLSGQEEVTTGLVFNGRPEEADGDRIVGIFVNTLPFSLSVHDQMWVELAQAAAEAEQEFSHYRRYPLAELQRAYGTQPLFEVAFNFNHFHVLQDLRESSAFEILEVNSFSRTNFPLSVGFDLNSITSDLVIFLEYDSARFSHEQVEAIGNYFSLTLNEMARDPFATSDNSYLLTENEYQRLVLDLNNTSEDYPGQVCLHELIEAQAERTPDAIALISGDEKLSYQQLNRRANQLAHYLKRRGVGPDVCVGLCVERSLEMVIGVLGTLKAGGAHLSLDPAYPVERLNFMIADAQLSVMVTQEKLLDGLTAFGGQVISLDGDASEIGAESEANVESGVTADNLMYVLYTSGSTGIPKGVQIPHRGVVSLFCFMQRHLGITEHDIVLSVTSLSFDIAVLELFLPLMTGACVALATREETLDVAMLGKRLETSGATFMQATPSTYRMLTESGWRAHGPLKVLCGGEALSRELAQQLINAGASLWNGYGPTETTIYSLTKLINLEEKRITIGHPVANTQVYVLDKNQHPVPVGLPGELYIGGEGVARGYLQRPELTAERFVPDPFSLTAGKRLYRTGDLVRYLSNGEVDYLGRMDQQVKIRGYRIELGEIEATLRTHPKVREAVAMVREFAVGDRRLVGYVVAEAETDRVALREYLRGKLPEYMLPSSFVLLEKLPQLPNGKINKNALPMPELTREAVAEAYVAPRMPIEEAVAGIWSELLGVEQVGIYDNFFALGGHSLLAAQVLVRVRDKFAVDVALQSLFDTPNVAGLALAVMQSQSQVLDVSETNDILAELEALSEEEAQTLVAGHGSQS